jgi:hypothetical protein
LGVAGREDNPAYYELLADVFAGCQPATLPILGSDALA